MNKNQKATYIPRKNPRLNCPEVHVNIEPPTFNILTQSPAKNIPHQDKKNQTPVKKNDNVNKRGPAPSTRNGQKRKEKSVESYSTEHADLVVESDSDSDFIPSNVSKKAKTILKGESSKSVKKKGSGTSKEDSRIPKQHKVKINVKIWRIIVAVRETKNSEGAISDSEVTGTVASRFSGVRTSREHAPDTSSFSRSRPGKSTLG